MKNVVWLSCLLLLSGCHTEQTAITETGYPIRDVKLNQVKLTDNFWLPRIQLIQNEVIAHAFDKCESEGRMDNFLIAENVMQGIPGEARGKMPFDDTDVYKILEGVAYSLINNPNPALEQYSDSIITIIARGQEPDGYITTWRTIDPEHPTSDWVPGGPRWSHLEISHELYNSGHLFEAAAAYHWATGKDELLNIALRNADLLVDVFGTNAYNAVPGHQIAETGLIKLYHITGKAEYLQLAKKFLDLRGDATKREIWGASNIQDHLPVLAQKEAVGHAVRAVFMYAGMTDIAAIYKASDYLEAVRTLWHIMTEKKMFLTGGIGARHHIEEFGDNYELPNLTAYSETCASIGSVYWNERLFRMTGDSKYYDIIERTLYNGVIAGISLDGTHFFYPNPLESDGKFGFNKGALTREAWFDCSCCPTNLIRFIPYVPNLIYATEGNNLYVNLFMGNEARIALPEQEVQISQTTNYPLDSKIRMDINPAQSGDFTLKVRIPGWALNETVPGSLYQYADDKTAYYSVAINGETLDAALNNGYLEINRIWSANDFLEIDLPMQVRRVIADAQIENLQQHIALEYGPFVYCAEEIDNQDHFDAIRFSADDDYQVDQVSDFLGGIISIRQKNGDRINTFIPYYTWSNRGIGRMKVWFPG